MIANARPKTTRNGHSEPVHTVPLANPGGDVGQARAMKGAPCVAPISIRAALLSFDESHAHRPRHGNALTGRRQGSRLGIHTEHVDVI